MIKSPPVAPPGLALRVEDAVARIRARNGRVRAILRERTTEALEDAQQRAAQPPRGPLHLVPYALKDVWDTSELETSGGSWCYRDRVPPRGSPVHRALEDAGAVLLGKSNLSDLAFTPESDNYLCGATANPHDASRTAGGSSGGAAAAVADGMAAFDWGSDFGGSIRLPAAFCGVFGLRLSASCWPVEGHFPAFPAELGLNGMGPIASSLEALTTVVAALAPALRHGSAEAWEPTGLALHAPDRFAAGRWPGVEAELREQLGQSDRPIRTAALPPPRHIDRLFAAYLATHLDVVFAGRMAMTAGASASAVTLGRFLGDRRIHPSTAAVLLTLAAARLTLYRDRAGVRREVDAIRRQVRALWDDGLVIVSPTTTFPAPEHGRTLRTKGCTAFVKLGNLVDGTGLAIPWGCFDDGLPRSVQLLGPPGSEHRLLELAGGLLALRR